MKKFFANIMALSLVVSTMAFAVGCGGGGQKVDESKSQLIIGLDESGYGRTWMDSIIADFEKNYAETEFEPGTGKKGVQVTLRYKPDAYSSSKIFQNISYADEDVYVTNALEYADFISRTNGSSAYLLDITDALTEGGDRSIYNRMKTAQRSYFNVGTEESPRLYAASFVEAFWGLFYDKDLFREKGFYELEGYKGLDGIDGTADDLWGPDGKEGTVDDGMPATFEDFKVLINMMPNYGVTPFTWTGAYSDYRANFLNTVIASYEGAENFAMRYNWEGEYKGEKIDKYNAWKLASQEGVKAMLAFAEFVTSDSRFYSEKAFGAQTHTEAQDEFITDGSIFTDFNPIGFLLEGGWWEHEATNTIKYREAQTKKTVNFGMLPMPKFIGTEGIEDQTNTKTVFSSTVSTASGAIFANKNTANPDLAKAFIKYFLAEEQNAKFTSMTNLTQPYDYELSEEQYAGLSSLAKERYMYSQSEDVEMISISVNNPYYVNNVESFKKWNVSGINNKTDAISGWLNYSGSLEDYFNEYVDTFTEGLWPIKK